MIKSDIVKQSHNRGIGLIRRLIRLSSSFILSEQLAKDMVSPVLLNCLLFSSPGKISHLGKNDAEKNFISSGQRFGLRWHRRRF